MRVEGQVFCDALNALARTAIAMDPGAGAAVESFARQYRQLFALPAFPTAGTNSPAPDATWRRYQQAAERVGKLLNEAATDAGRRLGTALAADGPDAAPMTSLRDLQALWIDCGEAAWSAAAHREEFAEAQAQLLAAWIALRATGTGG